MQTHELQLTPASVIRQVRPLPLLLLAIVTAACVVAVALASLRAQKAPLGVEALTLELGAIPKVEPLELQQIEADVAKQKNAEQPFVTGSIPPAKPFKVTGSSADIQRAVDCLAATVYYESAQEAPAGQLAVMQVVLNRMRHPAYPKTVCGVVFQGHERRTGCQFSYTCDGSLRRQPSAAAWGRYQQMARTMLSGQIYAPVGYATHYHADYVLPYWSASLDKLRVEGRHIFYRWKGGWGTPRAFVGGYRGAEAMFPKLALLSTVHRTGDAVLDAQALALPQEAVVLDPKAVASAMAVSDAGKGQYILRIDPNLDPAQLPILAQQICTDRTYCKVFAWANTTLMPARFPVEENQLATMAFSYLRNAEQSFERALWNCAVFPRTDKKQCIKRRVMIEGKAEELIPVTKPEDALPPVVAKPTGLRSLAGQDEAGAAAPTAAERSLGRRRPGDPE